MSTYCVPDTENPKVDKMVLSFFTHIESIFVKLMKRTRLLFMVRSYTTFEIQCQSFEPTVGMKFVLVLHTRKPASPC